MFQLNPYSLPTLIGSVLPLSLSIVIFLSKKKNITIRMFNLFLVSIFVWLFSYTIAYSTEDEDIARFFAKTACVAVFLMAPLYYHFGVSFLKIDQERKYLGLVWFIALVFLPFFVWGDAFLSTSRHWWGWYSKAGPLHPLSLLLWYGALFRLLFLFFRAYTDKTKTPVFHEQAKFLLIGFLIITPASLDYAQKYGADWYPFGWIFALLAAAVFAYTIFKHQLFNLRVIVTKFFTIAIWFIFLGRVILTANPQQRLADLALFIFVVIFGVLLMRSVNKEVEQKEKLRDLSENLEAKVEEQTKEVRKAYEVEKKARVELEDLNRAKNDFVLSAQHNLRTPLTVAKGYVQEVDSQLEEGNAKNLKDSMGKATGALDAMTHLVNRLLDITELKVNKTGGSNLEEKK